MSRPPEGLQLDLLSIIVRLEQIRDECFDEHDGLTSLGEHLLMDRVIECDVRRLRTYLTPETLAWADEIKGET